MRFQHFLLTRFNLGLYPADMNQAYCDKSGQAPARDPDKWMDDRLELFDKYCVPSVMNQSNKNFTWLVVFDPKTPSKYRERIERYRDDGVLVPLYAESRCRDEARVVAGRFRGKLLRFLHFEAALPAARDYITQKLNPDADYVITTRLDNDDAIHSDFVRRVQDFVPAEKPTRPGPLIKLIHRWTLDRPPKPASFVDRQIYKVIHGLAGRFLAEHVRNQDRVAINFTWGYALEGQRVGLFANERNSFVSLIEKTNQAGGILTVWVTDHKKIYRIAEVIELATEPLWVRVVHERNLLNQFIGEEMPLSKLSADDFGFNP